MALLAAPVGPVRADVNFAVENHASAGAVGSLTYALTIPPANDRVLIVSVQLGINCPTAVPTVSGVTYAGVALTRITSIVGTPCGPGTTRSEQWRLVAPATGNNDVVITLSGTLAAGGTIHSGAMAFTGVDQTTPVRAFNSASGTGTSSTVTVTSAVGDLVVNTVGQGNSVTVPGGGQTRRFLNNVSSSNTLNNSAASTAPGAASSVVMTWTFGASDEWQTISSSLQPSTYTSGLRAVSSVNQNGSALSLTLAVPTGTLGNDLMIAGIVIRPSTAIITAPSGWTLLRRQDNANPNANSLVIYYRVASPSEPASYTWYFNTSTGSAGGISSFSGVDTDNPTNVELPATTGATSTTSFAAPSVTTTVANTIIVTHYGYASSDRFTNAGMVKTFDVASLAAPNTVGISIGQFYKLQAAAGATGTLTATAASNADVGNMDTLALTPLVCGAVTNTTYFAATATPGTPGTVTLQWFPATSPVVILRKQGAFGASDAPTQGRTYAAGQAAGTATVMFAGAGGETSFTDTSGLANGTTYNYRVFPRTSNACYATGAGTDVTGRPVAAGGNEQWSYMLAGGSALRPPTTGDGGTLYVASNASRIVSLSTATGLQSWTPLATSQPVQGYLVWTSLSAGGARVFGGDQSGVVYAVDTATGTTAAPGWQVTPAGSTAIQAGVSIQIRAYSDGNFAAAYPGTYDVVFAATSNASTTNNQVFALRSDTGATLWTFPSPAQNVDQIGGQLWIDYGRNRLYVTSRAGAGAQSSLWVLSSLDGSVIAAFALGQISTAPTQSYDGTTLWVGNENGDLYAIDLAPPTPVLKWAAPLALGAAARVKGFVWEDFSTSGRIYFSTNNGTVRCFQDPGVGATPSAVAICSGWSAVSTAVAGATTPVIIDQIYVGSWTGAAGRIVPIDPATGTAGTVYAVGDGTKQVGDVTTDETFQAIYVGTTEGKVFKISLPLP